MATPLEMRVIYGDTDAMGIVYYGNYLRYFEAARGHFIRERGGSYREVEAAGFGLPVVEAHVVYRQSLRYDDLFTIDARVSEKKRVTVKFSYELRRGGELCAEGFTVHACVDGAGRPTRFPSVIEDLLNAP